VEVAGRTRKRDGQWGVPKAQRVPYGVIPILSDADDRHILAQLAGAKQSFGNYAYENYGYVHDTIAVRHLLNKPLQEMLVPAMCRTGRCFWRHDPGDVALRPLTWDDGPAWEFALEVGRDGDDKHYTLAGWLKRCGARLPLSQPVLLLAGGLVFVDEQAARL